MSSLYRTFSETSVKSTNSFDSEAVDEKEFFDFAPKNIYYVNPDDTSEQMMILPQGEPLPVKETKYKRKIGWNYGLKFRYVRNILILYFKVFILSISNDLTVSVVKRKEVPAVGRLSSSTVALVVVPERAQGMAHGTAHCAPR